MIHLLFYALKNYIACKYFKSDWLHSDVYRGYKLYKSYLKNKNRKSVLQTIKEVNALCKYWHCWPDMYFRFGHFLKQYNNYDVIKTFVPQSAYNRFCAKGLENSSYAILINDKVIFHNLMNYYQLPIPKLYFIFENNSFLNNGKELTDIEVDGILEDVKDDRIFVKKHTGGAASGISIICNNNGVLEYEGTRVSASFLRKHFANQKVFFEKQLIQEPVLSSFNPDTVNTIRVMTLNIDNKPQIISGAVRFGRVGSYVDNTAKGGVAVSLDITTGCLDEWGIREYNLDKFYEHPDSKKKFAGVKIEQWPEIKKLVLKTLKLFPAYKSVGFDIVTTSDGPYIIEINTGAGIYLSQMGKDIGLSHYFGNYILK